MKRTKEAEEKDTNMKNSDSYTANPTNAKTDDPSGMSAIARKLNSLTKKTKILIAAGTITVVLIGVIWGAWAYVHRKPDAIPATKPVRNSISQFAYASAAQYLSDDGLLNKQGNSNYSPASMWMALSMAMQGAGGETKTEMTQILNANKELSDKDYQSLMLSINGKYDGKSEMDTHNSLWIDKQYTPGAEFKKSLQSRFDAETISADYSNDAANKMSKWIEKNTKGMLKPDIKIDEYERLSLINTVYADGRWSKPFMESDTQDATFHGSQGDSKVAMMEQSASMDAVVGQGWQRVDKKFDNGGMLKIVLPDQGALDVFVKSPDVLHLLFSQEAGKSTVNLKMPRFTIENTFQSEETKKAMEKLGVHRAFDKNEADFRKMIEEHVPLFIGSIVQGTKIEVNEAGAKAAAYTKIGMKSTSAPVEHLDFTVDRPFLYEYDTPDGIPLFIGVVRNL